MGALTAAQPAVAAAPRNMAPMHEWACATPAAPSLAPAAHHSPQPPLPALPVGDVIELPPVEGWALWHSLAAAQHINAAA